MAIDLSALQGAEARRRFVLTSLLPELDLRPFIDGDFQEPRSADTLEVTDPMTQEKITDIPAANAADIDAAVSAARRAFDDGRWSDLHPRERARLLFRLADLIERDLSDIALLESLDAGKRIAGLTAWDIPNAAEVYRYYAGWADKISGRLLPSSPGVQIVTRREPVGVCAAIVPWNFPFPCMSWKIGPALAAGCTVVLKSAERAPLSAQYLAGLVREAEFPPGVVNILTGVGETAGRKLVADARVDKITFTGEVTTARDILKSSLAHMPRVTFELGDKAPTVILADADLERAVPAAAGSMFGVSGQNCCAGSRLIADRAVVDEVVKGLKHVAENRLLGDPLDEATEQGPQIDAVHVASIDSHVRRAIADGAVCLTGGSASGIGQFYAPTVLTEVDPTMAIAREEVFGPVGAVIPVSGVDEAIAVANDRTFGLAASIWTRDPAAAERFARAVRAGTCWINCYEYFDSVAPWGGRKLSGVGRELGVEGIDAFLETKTVVTVV
jgi:aldehyde dehydrogenase (NAD+)